MNKKNILKACFLLLAGFLLTFLVTFRVHIHSETEATHDYLDVCNEIAFKIRNTVQDHSQFVRSASSFIESADTVTSRNWKIFETKSDFTNELPGEQPLGYSVFIAGDQLQSHIQIIRKEGHPDYFVNPQGKRPFYTSVIHVEPIIKGNLDVFGYDMFTDPVRRKAMEISRDSDKVTLTGKVILEPITDKNPHAGVLMYAPVYHAGSPSETVSQRRAAIRGWTFSVYRIDDLIQGILGRWDLNMKQHIHLQIFDDRVTDLSKLYDSQVKEKITVGEAQSRKVSIPIKVNGRRWILNFEQLGEPVFQIGNIELVTVISGLIISILISLLFLSLLRTTSEAKKIAGNLTRELKDYTLRLSAAMEAGTMAWWEIDSATGSVVYDKRKTEMLSYPPEKFIHYADFTNLLHPDDQEKAMNAMRQHLEGKADKYDVEYRILTRSGEYKWCHDIGAVTEKDPNGKPTKVTGLVLDIDERKKAESKLQESEDRYSAMTANISDVIAIIDAEGIIKYQSPNVEKWLGWLPEEVVGNSNFSFIHPEDIAMAQEKFLILLNKEGSVLTFELRIKGKDGSYKPVELTANSLLNDQNINGILVNYRDISERKATEQKLNSSESKYQLLFENMVEGFSLQEIITDENDNPVDFRFLDANAAYERLTGLKQGDIIGKTIRSILPQSDLRQIEKYGKVALTGEPVTFEYFSNTLHRHLRVKAFCPKPGQFASVFEDVTQLKQAEQELRNNEARYRSMTANISDVIGIMDANGMMKYKSSNIARFFGWSPKERVGTSGFATIHPDDIEMAQKVFFQLLQNENSTLTLEFRYQCKDGSFKPVELTATNLLSHPLINGILMNYRDITERKRIDGQLRESEKRYRLLIETASEGIFVAQDGKFKFVNPILLELFGYSKEEILLVPFIEIVHPDDRERIRNNHLKRLKVEPVETRYHFRILKKGGITRWVELNSVKIDWEGEQATLNLISDITVNKEAEIEIKHKNEELQKLNSEKDKFFSIIAHDLRGPLGGFMGLTEMMADENQYFTESEIKEMTLELSHSARNTFKLLENLLEWSQMDRGQTAFQPQKLDLKDITAECVILIGEAAKGKNISIVMDIQGISHVYADKNMIQTVIRNLLSNAVKFTPNDGKVTISAKSAENNMTVISVQDTGIGMTDEMRNNLFRLDVNTKRPGTNGENSTGLGLLLCKEFVERHKGKIWIESERFKGSVFSFTVPLGGEQQVKNAPQVEVVAVVPSRRIDNLRILIAEDDEISVKLITIIVKGFSKQIFTAKTGAEAVEICRNNPEIDVVLMDIAMPVMDGYEATRQIRLFNKEVIIIAQTTFALHSDHDKAIAAGCNDYITKPLSKDSLLEIIKKNL